MSSESSNHAPAATATGTGSKQSNVQEHIRKVLMAGCTVRYQGLEATLAADGVVQWLDVRKWSGASCERCGNREDEDGLCERCDEWSEPEPVSPPVFNIASD
jgi:hypothetical protein